jgi:hypothetical protein
MQVAALLPALQHPIITHLLKETTSSDFFLPSRGGGGEVLLEPNRSRLMIHTLLYFCLYFGFH